MFCFFNTGFGKVNRMTKKWLKGGGGVIPFKIFHTRHMFIY